MHAPLLGERIERQCSLVELFLLVGEYFVVVVQLVPHVRVVDPLIAGFAVDEVLEISLGAARTDLPSKPGIIFVGHVLVLGFSDHGLSVGGVLERRAGEPAHCVLEERLGSDIIRGNEGIQPSVFLGLSRYRTAAYRLAQSFKCSVARLCLG